jgi:hypothetical protein
LPLHQAERFEVYALEDMAVSVGESFRFTRNGEAIGGSAIVNGETARIAGFTPEGDMSLQDGRSVGGDYGHIAYGYVATSHKAQGSTVDTVLIAENPANGAASPEQLYVSASRARKSVRIYTPSRHNLLQAVSRKNPGVCAATVVQTARNDIEEEAEHRTNYEARIRNDEAHRAWQARMKLYETWPPGALRTSWNIATRLHALWDKAVVVMATFLGFSPEGGT